VVLRSISEDFLYVYCVYNAFIYEDMNEEALNNFVLGPWYQAI
jgi:hypothetical protein